MAIAEKDNYIRMGRPHNTCQACGTPIGQAGKHPSVLRRAPPGSGGQKDVDGPQRHDYCTACWQELADQDFVGFWLTRREAPKMRKIETRKERNAALLAWFEHLRSQAPDDETRQSLFFLGHLLMKYGVFKWQRTDVAEDGTETVVFRQPGSEEEINVVVTDFSDDRSVEIKRELDEFLSRYANAQPEAEVNQPTGKGSEDGDAEG